MNSHDSKVALITGIAGQDGSYLAELLIEKGYTVHGIVRRHSNSANSLHRLKDVINSRSLRLHYGDVTDALAISNLVREVRPHEIYNLAAQSHVGVSFEIPAYTANVDGSGTLNILEAVRCNGLAEYTKIYQASTSELYGDVREVPQTEKTPFYPRSPYGVAKLYAYWITVNYREAYRMFACNGILFNHESPRRGEEFVTRKVTLAMAEIKLGVRQSLVMGNLSALRDWGHARDYVEMQYKMLQQSEPVDYVIATGRQYSVEHFIDCVGKAHDMVLRWEGEGLGRKAYWTNAPRHIDHPIVEVSTDFYRPAEVQTLLGDSSKAKSDLGWEATTTFEELVQEMATADFDLVRAKSGL